ncbi:Hypp5482 [Branchiostoma lanceolatum]|uniref:Hypp5482 protein n=1 Tax=Branchiostoma lanceolatum TaxID=7740 RepID=A0A8J9VPU1_BRALA|nr:Hypp5482 [Branchiostoma lanceolatum]
MQPTTAEGLLTSTLTETTELTYAKHSTNVDQVATFTTSGGVSSTSQVLSTTTSLPTEPFTTTQLPTALETTSTATTTERLPTSTLTETTSAKHSTDADQETTYFTSGISSTSEDTIHPAHYDNFYAHYTLHNNATSHCARNHRNCSNNGRKATHIYFDRNNTAHICQAQHPCWPRDNSLYVWCFLNYKSYNVIASVQHFDSTYYISNNTSIYTRRNKFSSNHWWSTIHLFDHNNVTSNYTLENNRTSDGSKTHNYSRNSTNNSRGAIHGFSANNVRRASH